MIPTTFKTPSINPQFDRLTEKQQESVSNILSVFLQEVHLTHLNLSTWIYNEMPLMEQLKRARIRFDCELETAEKKLWEVLNDKKR